MCLRLNGFQHPHQSNSLDHAQTSTRSVSPWETLEKPNSAQARHAVPENRLGPPLPLGLLHGSLGRMTRK